MEETKDPKASPEGGGTQARDAEATSPETLSDIEESESVGAGSAGSSPLETSSPEPERGGEDRADGSETGGPM